MINAEIPVLGFAAYSGTGKTTLLTQLIPILNKQKLRIGLIKHSHHNFEIDKPGKDSYKLRQAGATPVMLVSSHRRAIITEFDEVIEPRLNDQLKYINQAELDLILVEGFKAEAIPKIELHRPALNKNLIFTSDTHIIALATDEKISLNKSNCDLTDLEISKTQIPTLLDLNNPQMIADFIVTKFLGHNHD